MNEHGSEPTPTPVLGDSEARSALRATGLHRDCTVEESKEQGMQLLVPAPKHTSK